MWVVLHVRTVFCVGLTSGTHDTFRLFSALALAARGQPVSALGGHAICERTVCIKLSLLGGLLLLLLLVLLFQHSLEVVVLRARVLLGLSVLVAVCESL